MRACQGSHACVRAAISSILAFPSFFRDITQFCGGEFTNLFVSGASGHLKMHFQTCARVNRRYLLRGAYADALYENFGFVGLIWHCPPSFRYGPATPRLNAGLNNASFLALLARS